jgi:hypothetical protein
MHHEKVEVLARRLSQPFGRTGSSHNLAVGQGSHNFSVGQAALTTFR